MAISIGIRCSAAGAVLVAVAGFFVVSEGDEEAVLEAEAGFFVVSDGVAEIVAGDAGAEEGGELVAGAPPDPPPGSDASCASVIGGGLGMRV